MCVFDKILTPLKVFNKNFAEEIKSLKAKSIKEEIKEAPSLSISTNNSLHRRRSTLSSSTTTENNSVYSHTQADDAKLTSPTILSRQSTNTQTPGVGGIPVLPTLPVMSPISRAFSIRTPVTENSPGLSAATLANNNTTAFENATMSRAESLSRTLKMSLRKKSRKKSQNTTGSNNSSASHHISSSNNGNMLD